MSHSIIKYQIPAGSILILTLIFILDLIFLSSSTVPSTLSITSVGYIALNFRDWTLSPKQFISFIVSFRIRDQRWLLLFFYLTFIFIIIAAILGAFVPVSGYSMAGLINWWWSFVWNLWIGVYGLVKRKKYLKSI